MRTGRPPKLDPVTLSADIVALRGNLSAIARKHEVSRQAVQNAVNRKTNLRRVLHDAREGLLDEVEIALYDAATDGAAWAVLFVLRTLGRERGYVERPQELPPLRQLLNALPEDVGEVVREALLRAMQSNRIETPKNLTA